MDRSLKCLVVFKSLYLVIMLLFGMGPHVGHAAWYDTYDFSGLGVTGFYPLDGNANDVSGNGLNGTAYNCSSATGHFAECYDFNGVMGSSGSRVWLPPFPHCEALSIAAWVYMEEYAPGTTYLEHYTIFLRRQDYADKSLMIDKNGYLHLAEIRGSGNPSSVVQSTSTVPLNGWHHVAGTLDQNYIRVYIDGILAGESASAGPLYWGGSYYCTHIGMGSD
ncbi:MAG TPA: LamG domain-containing protein, partial [bacterium]|nr:LamG domain-containing protein [bacterium]